MEKNKTEKKKIQKKICPLNPDLECENCRWFETTDRRIKRCRESAIIDALDYIKLNIGGER